MFDLTEVKAAGSFEPIPAGTYNVFCVEAQVKQTKDGTGDYINCKFKITDGEYDGSFLFTMFNIKNKNAKAVEIGMSQLKSFMMCCGLTDFKLASVTHLEGLNCSAVVKIKNDAQYGDKNVISYFKARDTSVVTGTKAGEPDGLF